MSKHFQKLPVACWAAFPLFAVGCGDQPSAAKCNSALVVGLELPTDGSVNQVAYSITGNDIEPITGTINVSAPQSTASVEVFGIPPGQGYLFSMSATSTTETATCQGSSWFDVTVGVSTEIDVFMNCKGTERFGGVRVNGKLNLCAELTRVIVSPLQTADGYVIDVEAHGEDEESDFIRYRWTSTAGDFYYPNEPITRFDCNGAGENEIIRIEVSDDEFQYCSDAWTVEVSCVDGELGGNGGGGGGGAGGSGGSTVPSGSGGNAGSIGIGFTAGTEDPSQCTVSLNLR
jgi:hypothetical protein